MKLVPALDDVVDGPPDDGAEAGGAAQYDLLHNLVVPAVQFVWSERSYCALNRAYVYTVCTTDGERLNLSREV